MVHDDEQKTSTRVGNKKVLIVAAALVALFAIAIVVMIVFFGMVAGDPRGEASGPGP